MLEIKCHNAVERSDPEGATALCALDFSKVGREKTDILNENIYFGHL